jgi:hypothetical protein
MSTSTTPSPFSLVTYSCTWLNIFKDVDQWKDVDRFAALQARDLDTVQGFRRLCSTSIGHGIALCLGGVQLVHHIHQDTVDDLDSGSEELWALTPSEGAFC